MKYQGKISHWDDAKGFGFVEPNGGGDRAFVHIKSFQRRSRRPIRGDVIVYGVVRDTKGRLQADDINLVVDPRKRQSRQKRNQIQAGSVTMGQIVTVLFCLFLVTLIVLHQLPVEVLWLYVSASVVSIVIYALDKTAAQQQRWRTRESTLHLVAVLGGWPGAYYAQNKLRHKSVKREFKRVYWVTVCINIAGLFWLMSPDGKVVLRTVINLFY